MLTVPPKVVCPISLALPDGPDSSGAPRNQNSHIFTMLPDLQKPQGPKEKKRGKPSLEKKAVCRPGKAWLCPDAQPQVFLPSQAISGLSELNGKTIVVSTLPGWSSARGETILHRQSLCSDTLSHLPHPVELISVHSQMMGK